MLRDKLNRSDFSWIDLWCQTLHLSVFLVERITKIIVKLIASTKEINRNILYCHLENFSACITNVIKIERLNIVNNGGLCTHSVLDMHFIPHYLIRTQRVLIFERISRDIISRFLYDHWIKTIYYSRVKSL